MSPAIDHMGRGSIVYQADPTESGQTMYSSRRALLTSFLAAGAVTAAGCHQRVGTPAIPHGLDQARLAEGFARLAARALPAILDLGVMTLDTGSLWCADGDRRFPMQDLFMAPLAAAALAEVDAGRLRLNETLRIGPGDLSPPPGRVNRLFAAAGSPASRDIPAADLIALAVQEGDNTAADVIMRRIGGPGAVTAWLRALQIMDMRVDRFERELQLATTGLTQFQPEWRDPAAWDGARRSEPAQTREAAIKTYLQDPRDTTTVGAALTFLAQLSSGALLSKASTALLIRLMTTSDTGRGRLAAGLPQGARLAHKSGASPTDLGLTPAINDFGLVTLGNGRRFAVAAFLQGSTATLAQSDSLIADAARLAVSALI